MIICPNCESEDAEAERIERCSACGWMQVWPDGEPKFDPNFTEKMMDFRWCGFNQEQMRRMRDFALAHGWKP